MISDEEAQSIKEQLLAQISSFPEDKKEAAKEKILSMTNEELEQFVGQNTDKSCVFCSILEGKVPSYKIDENNESIAILEITPLSKGHALIVSKAHDKPASQELAARVAEKLKKLNPKEIKFNPTKILGHNIIEVIPLYGGEKQRTKASESELQKLKDEIIAQKEEVREEIKEIKEEKKLVEPLKLPKLKSRIP
jgi:diadenosine tetraphosphate (Ap4A) HIT family hydrolase